MAKARIAVIGAGLMGHGIAQVFALAGHDVTITDSFKPNLDTVKTRISANLRDLGDDETAVDRVRPIADLAEAVRDADYVVEAISEDLPLKQKLFAEIESHVRPDTILASNTSVIPITAIMQGLRERSRALGTHWWNPPYLVPLVEVIGTQWTSPQAIEWTMALHAAAGKQPAHVKKDVPGFIGNRLQHALWREAVSLGRQRTAAVRAISIRRSGRAAHLRLRGRDHRRTRQPVGHAHGRHPHRHRAQTVGSHINPGWQALAGHLLFLVVLALRPEGLFPKVRG